MFFSRLGGLSKQVFERRVTSSKSTPAHLPQELREKNQVPRFRECETRRIELFAPARLHCASISPPLTRGHRARPRRVPAALRRAPRHRYSQDREGRGLPRDAHGRVPPAPAQGRDGRVAGVRPGRLPPRGTLRAERGGLGDLPAVRLLGVVVVDPCPTFLRWASVQ